MGAKNQEERFNQLRAAYVKQRTRRDEIETALRRKYGIGYGGTLHDHWLTSPERKRRESADKATDKASRPEQATLPGHPCPVCDDSECEFLEHNAA